jgi:hypothetical protein
MLDTRNMPVTLFVLVVISVICSNDASRQRGNPERHTKEKAERWTPRRAFAQVRPYLNIQLLPFSLVPLNVLQEFWQQVQLAA